MVMRIRDVQHFTLALLCLLLGRLDLSAAERSPSGQAIYRQLCVKCHGKNGEGVKGKNEDPLVGDRSLDNLTRYIDREMPENAPEKCKGADAEAVARYIYDAFYSREARLRKNPPRVELAHLTNRQYLVSVADLVGRFIEPRETVGKERGLTGRYYNHRNSQKDQGAYERVDRQVQFDFGEASHDGKPVGKEGFSVQWRGSLLADETGDYEFIVKTPNGARLWVNNDNEPLIDAWVASGETTEATATRRLIGGRVYPLKLDLFKYKDKTASMTLQWKPPHGTRQTIPARNLSPARVAPTFIVTTPFPADDSSIGYERGVQISKGWNDATTQAAIETANYVVKHLDSLSRSQPQDADRASKVSAFCTEFTAAALRRPLTEEQKRVFVSAHFKGTPSIEEAVKRVVLLTLKSPRFLYLGLDAAKPDDFTVAERLSFSLWDSLPDRELTKAAAEGRLLTREQVTQQATRMLGDPRARAKMQFFLHHWLQMNRVEDLAKDPKRFPDFTPEIIADLRTSLNLFLEDVVWNGSSDFRQLLRADYLFLNGRLAKYYGIEIPQAGTDDDFVKVQMDPKQRAGVVTHPYLLAAFSYPKFTSPIHRGVFLTRNVVGRHLKPPVMAVAFKDEEFAPNLTMREKIAQLTSSQACQSCHAVINPLGFSLEHFDAVGRFRTAEGGRPIDAVTDYQTDDGRTIRLTGARDLAEFAAGSEQAHHAFVEQLFHQTVKQPMLAYGADEANRLRQSFASSGFSVQKLLVDIVGISSLRGVEKPVSSADKR